MKDLQPVEYFCEKLMPWIEMRIAMIPGGVVCSKEDMKQEMLLQLVVTHQRMLQRDDVQDIKAVEHFIREDMRLRLANFLAETLRPYSYKKATNWVNANSNPVGITDVSLLKSVWQGGLRSTTPSGVNCKETLMDEEINLRLDIEEIIEANDQDGIIRMFYDGYSATQIAKALGVKVSHIYYRLQHLRSRFKRVLTQYGFAPKVTQ